MAQLKSDCFLVQSREARRSLPGLASPLEDHTSLDAIRITSTHVARVLDDPLQQPYFF